MAKYTNNLKNIADYFKAGDVYPSQYAGLGPFVTKDIQGITQTNTGFKIKQSDDTYKDLSELFQPKYFTYSTPGTYEVDITGAKEIKTVMFGGGGGGGGKGQYYGDHRGLGGSGGAFTVATIKIDGETKCVLVCGLGGKGAHTYNLDNRYGNAYGGAEDGGESSVSVKTQSGTVTHKVYAYGGRQGLNGVTRWWHGLSSESYTDVMIGQSSATNFHVEGPTILKIIPGAVAFTTTDTSITDITAYPGEDSRKETLYQLYYNNEWKYIGGYERPESMKLPGATGGIGTYFDYSKDKTDFAKWATHSFLLPNTNSTSTIQRYHSSRNETDKMLSYRFLTGILFGNGIIEVGGGFGALTDPRSPTSNLGTKGSDGFVGICLIY